jgi:hypothetical protein
MSSAFTNHAQETLAVYHAAYQAGWKDCFEKYVAPKHATAEFTEADRLAAEREFNRIVGISDETLDEIYEGRDKLCKCKSENGVVDVCDYHDREYKQSDAENEYWSGLDAERT